MENGGRRNPPALVHHLFEIAGGVHHADGRVLRSGTCADTSRLDRDDAADAEFGVDAEGEHLAHAVVVVDGRRRRGRFQGPFDQAVSDLHPFLTGLEDVAPLQPEQQLAQGQLELPDAGLVGVGTDQVTQVLVLVVGLEIDQVRFDAVAFTEPRQNEAAGDLDLFLDAVAVEMDDLAAVDDRCGHRVEGVGGEDEVAVGKIDIDGRQRVLVVKEVVLLGVEDLEQRRDRHRLRLVGLVEDEHAVRGPHLDQSLDDRARLRAFVGEAVAAQRRLVAHATERDLVVGQAEVAGDRDGERGLADAGRSDEEKRAAALLPLVGSRLVEFPVAPDQVGEEIGHQLFGRCETEVAGVEAGREFSRADIDGADGAPWDRKQGLDELGVFGARVAVDVGRIVVDCALHRLRHSRIDPGGLDALAQRIGFRPLAGKMGAFEGGRELCGGRRGRFGRGWRLARDPFEKGRVQSVFVTRIKVRRGDLEIAEREIAALRLEKGVEQSPQSGLIVAVLSGKEGDNGFQVPRTAGDRQAGVGDEPVAGRKQLLLVARRERHEGSAQEIDREIAQLSEMRDGCFPRHDVKAVLLLEEREHRGEGVGAEPVGGVEKDLHEVLIQCGFRFAQSDHEGAVSRQNVDLLTMLSDDVFEVVAKHELGKSHDLGGFLSRRVKGLDGVGRQPESDVVKDSSRGGESSTPCRPW